MTQFRIDLKDGSNTVVEADLAAHTRAGEIVFETGTTDTDWTRLARYRAEDVTAVYRRGPATDGTPAWTRQPTAGPWWCY
ncbi:hypothetical protein [Streptomyces sp. YIM 98790]|uniref:hypothetical protein n=1 Tax=Streptomyces sp. YIM 98790 TaxID=2689077 RepID=UPI00140BE39E|nr:hypothetical protein [Streptomyces sp. YIM 98790]